MFSKVYFVMDKQDKNIKLYIKRELSMKYHIKLCCEFVALIWIIYTNTLFYFTTL